MYFPAPAAEPAPVTATTVVEVGPPSEEDCTNCAWLPGRVSASSTAARARLEPIAASREGRR